MKKRRAINVAVRSGIKTSIKTVLAAVEKKNMEEATKSLKNAISANVFGVACSEV